MKYPGGKNNTKISLKNSKFLSQLFHLEYRQFTFSVFNVFIVIIYIEHYTHTHTHNLY